MKIAVFYNLHFGGAKRAVYEQVRGLKKLGHVVDVYTTDPYSDIFDFQRVSSKLVRYKYDQVITSIPFLGRLFDDLKTFFVLKSLHKKIATDIDKQKYDVVLVHPDVITQSPYLLRYLKTKSFYYCQEPLRMVYEYVLRPNKNIGFIKYSYEIVTRFIRKNDDIKNVRSASHTIASCYHVRERMIESYGVYPSVCYLGIDTNVFRPINLKKNNQVLFLGNKDVWNDGYDLVSDALSLIPKAHRPNLKIISWVKNNGERLTDKELVEEYNSSILTLCVSRLETFGLVPLESMSCGVPVIATNVSGHRETVIDGKTGFLVEFNPNEIKEKIQYLVNNPSYAADIGENARNYIVDKWTWKKSLKTLESILSS